MSSSPEADFWHSLIPVIARWFTEISGDLTLWRLLKFSMRSYLNLGPHGTIVQWRCKKAGGWERRRRSGDQIPQQLLQWLKCNMRHFSFFIHILQFLKQWIICKRRLSCLILVSWFLWVLVERLGYSNTDSLENLVGKGSHDGGAARIQREETGWRHLGSNKVRAGIANDVWSRTLDARIASSHLRGDILGDEGGKHKRGMSWHTGKQI